ncbi:MAG: hypothetical protein EOM24_04895 [Chloroflexia bacterium]|nr:hypothetical protein [Chloroflexia bacterium]
MATDLAQADFAQAEMLIEHEDDICDRERLAARIAVLHQQLDVALQHYTAAASNGDLNVLFTELQTLETIAAAFPDNPTIPQAMDWLRSYVQ